MILRCCRVVASCEFRVGLFATDASKDVADGEEKGADSDDMEELAAFPGPAISIRSTKPQ